MQPIVCGVDPSSKKIAIAIHVPGQDVELHTILLPGTVLSRKCARTYTKFKRLIKTYRKLGPVYIIIEAPVVGRGGAKPTIMQSKINGNLQSAGVVAKAVVLDDANVSSWKKTIVGNGHATKDDVAKWLKEHRPTLYARTGGDQDLVDACVILEYGTKIVKQTMKGS